MAFSVLSKAPMLFTHTVTHFLLLKYVNEAPKLLGVWSSRESLTNKFLLTRLIVMSHRPSFLRIKLYRWPPDLKGRPKLSSASAIRACLFLRIETLSVACISGSEVVVFARWTYALLFSHEFYHRSFGVDEVLYSAFLYSADLFSSLCPLVGERSTTRFQCWEMSHCRAIVAVG